MVRYYTYESTVDINYWKKKLNSNGYNLTDNNKKLLKSTKQELWMNNCIRNIYNKGLEFGLYVPCLPKMNGNCLFVSLENVLKSRNIDLKADILRKAIAMIFYLLADSKEFVKGGLTIREMFEFSNEINYVFCKKSKKIYKYTFDTFCVDIYSEGSYSRLPTEAILLVFSLIFNIKFKIIRDNGNIIELFHQSIENNNQQIDNQQIDNQILYLANIDDFHYIPLVKFTDFDNMANYPRCPYYCDYMQRFHNWARKVADIVGLYYDKDLENNTNNNESTNNESSNNESSNNESNNNEQKTNC